MIFHFQPIMTGVLNCFGNRKEEKNLHDVIEEIGKRNDVKTKLGITPKQFSARIIQLRKIADKFNNTGDEEDPGMILVREALGRIDKLTDDDKYRIVQLSMIFNYLSALKDEPNGCPNWAWRSKFTKRMQDLYVLMLTSEGWFPKNRLTEELKFNRASFVKKIKKHLTEAVISGSKKLTL